ncbi:hypothetical protein ACQCLI_12965 [Pseudomonas nitroreducens]|uniref:hypothetical protein n=1 Tax=Pseudomonas nitroreducens TaxID=46680 RepID=UPI00031BA2E9|nr:hypothetical protein [Pseudomonas nitroreducens]
MDEPLTLDAFYAAVEQHIAEHLAGAQRVRFWPRVGDALALPSVLLEIAEFEPGPDPGTGEVALDCRCEARIVVAPEQQDATRQAAHLSTQLSILLRAQTWGLAVDPALFTSAEQDYSRPELDNYLVWRVEWTQTLYLGEEQWPWPDESGYTLMIGLDPETGPGNEPKYVPAEGLP